MSHIILNVLIDYLPQPFMSKLFSFPFHGRESGGTEKYSNYHEVTQFISNKS